MNAGALFAGRFRLLRLEHRRDDRDVWLANDTSTRRVVSVHLPQHSGVDLAAEARDGARLAGVGMMTVLGLWRDGATAGLVVARREPSVRLFGCEPVESERAIEWLIDLSTAVARAHASVGPLGIVRPERVVVTGQRAALDASTPKADATVADDLLGLGEVLRHALGGRAGVASTPWGRPVVERRLLGIPAGLPRGVRQLVIALLHPDPARRPPSAAVVRLLATRVSRHPSRALGPARTVRWRLRQTQQLLTADPATGQWRRVGGPTTLRTVRRTAQRLNAAGWSHRVQAVALGPRDALWIAVLALVGGVILPIVGAPIAGVVALRWRTRRCHPGVAQLGERVELSLRPSPVARVVAVALGISLLLAALALWFFAPLAIPPGVVAMVLAWILWREPVPHGEDRTRRLRLNSAVAGVKTALPRFDRPLNEVLGLQGELQALSQHLAVCDVDGGVVAEAEALYRDVRVCAPQPKAVS